MRSRKAHLSFVLLFCCSWLLAGATVNAADLCTWTAAVDGDWNRAGNWSCGHVPSSADTAVIGPAATRAQVTAAATASTLIIEEGGELFYNAGVGVDFLVGAFTIADGGRYIHKRTATNPLSGSNRSFAPNSTVEIQSFPSSANPLPIFGNLIVSNTSYIQLSGKLGRVTGDFTKRGAGELRLAFSDIVSLTIAGDLEVANGVLLMQSVTTSNAVTLTVAGDVRIASGATLQRGAGAGPWIHTVGGNWIDDGVYTPGTAGNTTVLFNAGGTALLTRKTATTGDTESFCNLSVAAGTVVDTGTDFIAVGASPCGGFTQAGVIRRHAPEQTVTAGGGPVTYLDGRGRSAVIITQTGGDALGATPVTISTNSAPPVCGEEALAVPAVAREIEISPPNSTGAATLRAYFTPEEPDEANGNTVEAPFDLALYHCDGSHWTKFGGAGGSDANGVYVEAEGVNAFSPFAIARESDGPTGVDVAEFSARVEGSRIFLHWVTANELDILGFHLYRAHTQAGSPVRLTREIIGAHYFGNPIGDAYSWADPDLLEIGATRFYWLEVISATSRVRHGPAIVTRQRLQVFLPSLVR